MMVDISARSLIAELDAAEEHDIDIDSPQHFSSRFASQRREQPSRTRFATQSRYSRKRSANSTAPVGPRRRFRKG